MATRELHSRDARTGEVTVTVFEVLEDEQQMREDLLTIVEFWDTATPTTTDIANALKALIRQRF